MNTEVSTEAIEFQNFLEKLRNELFKWANLPKAIKSEVCVLVISGDKIYLSFKLNGVDYE